MYGARYFGARYFGGRYFGKTGLVVLGAYNGAHYFGRRYFGRRYWALEADSDPFSMVQTNTLAGSGSGTVSASFSLTADFAMAQVGAIAGQGSGTVGASIEFGNNDFSFGAPIEVGMGTGSATFSCTLEFTTTTPGVGRYHGCRYMGPRYFGRRYWSPAINFNMAQTNTIAGNGVGLVAGNFSTEVGLVQTNMLVGSGSGTVAGDLTFSATAAQGHGFEMGGRREIIRLPRKKTTAEEAVETIFGDKPKEAKPPRTPEKRSPVFEQARQSAEEIIKAVAVAHAAAPASESVRFANVRTALKPIAPDLGNWNWVSVYQRLYDAELTRQIKSEMDAIDLAEEEAITLILMGN